MTRDGRTDGKTRAAKETAVDSELRRGCGNDDFRPLTEASGKNRPDHPTYRHDSQHMNFLTQPNDAINTTINTTVAACIFCLMILLKPFDRNNGEAFREWLRDFRLKRPLEGKKTSLPSSLSDTEWLCIERAISSIAVQYGVDLPIKDVHPPTWSTCKPLRRSFDLCPPTHQALFLPLARGPDTRANPQLSDHAVRQMRLPSLANRSSVPHQGTSPAIDEDQGRRQGGRRVAKDDG